MLPQYFNDCSEAAASVSDPAELQRAASDYVRRGWSVLPLRGKRPAIDSWKELQSRPPTPAEIESWFVDAARRPSGLGIVTGKISGIVIVDCDSPADAAFWHEHFPGSPLVVATGGGGEHLYYAMPEEAEIRNRAGALGRKIDLRGEGGYAAAPPSLHVSGRRYAWQKYDAASSLPLFDAAWLNDQSQPARLPSIAHAGHIRNAVAYIGRIRATAGEGGHNATFRAACKLRDAGLSLEESLQVLSHWNETNALPPWSPAELRHKIRSAYGESR